MAFKDTQDLCITCKNRIVFIVMNENDVLTEKWFCTKMMMEIRPHDDEHIVECDAYKAK